MFSFSPSTSQAYVLFPVQFNHLGSAPLTDKLCSSWVFPLFHHILLLVSCLWPLGLETPLLLAVGGQPLGFFLFLLLTVPALAKFLRVWRCGGDNMSLAVGAHSCTSKEMGFEEGREASEKNGMASRGGNSEAGETEESEGGRHGGEEERLNRQISDACLYTTEEDEEEEDDKDGKKPDLGPQVSLKQQLEKDKDDESLRRWKEQLLGSVDLDSVGESLEPEVKILSLSIISPGRPDLILAIPVVPTSKGSWFTLKEGSHYRLKFSFLVSNNIVSGLRYTNRVWKAGVRVDSTKEMLGTFSPQPEPYVCELPEETTPCGIFARGSYSARSRFVDDDGKCYLEINYTFEIRKEWLPNS